MLKTISLIVFIIILAGFIMLIFSSPISVEQKPVSLLEKSPSVLNISNFEYSDPGFDQLINEYKAINPRVGVKVNTYSKNIYYSIIRSSISSGIGPDLFEIDNMNMLNSYITENSIVDLGSFISFDRFPQELVDFVCVLNGQTYATPPLIKKAYVVFYNKDLLDRLNISNGSKTIRQFIDDCRTIKENGMTPLAFGIKDLECLRNLVTQFGVYSREEKLLTGFSAEDFSIQTRNILGLKDLFPEDFYKMDYEDAKLAFIEGKAAAILGTDNQELEFSSRCRFGLAMAHLYSDKNYKSFYDYSGSYVININSANKIEAIEFTKFISKKENDVFLPQYNNKYLLNWLFKFSSQDLTQFEQYLEKLQETLAG